MIKTPKMLQLKQQMEALSSNLADLNQVYNGMLKAMNKTKIGHGWSKNTQAETHKFDVSVFITMLALNG